MNYRKLKDELVNDPLARGYSGMTDQEAADSLNTPDRIVTCECRATIRSLMADLGPTEADDIITALEAAATNNNITARALKLLSPAEGGIDLGHASTRAQIDGLVTAGVLTSVQGTALKGLAEKTVSRAEELGLPVISAQMVNNARTMAW